MIVLPDRALVIITPPKTGGTSLHNDLTGPGGPGRAIYSADPAGDVSKHGMLRPIEYAGGNWRVALLVRNPLDRLVSQFTHHANHRTSEGLAAPSLLDFLTAPPDYYAFGWTISQTVQRSSAIFSEVWQIEEIAQRLAQEKLPQVGRHNALWHLPTAQLLADEETRTLAERIAAEDRQAFGY